jgi:hypothetical protein
MESPASQESLANRVGVIPAVKAVVVAVAALAVRANMAAWEAPAVRAAGVKPAARRGSFSTTAL